MISNWNDAMRRAKHAVAFGYVPLEIQRQCKWNVGCEARRPYSGMLTEHTKEIQIEMRRKYVSPHANDVQINTGRETRGDSGGLFIGNIKGIRIKYGALGYCTCRGIQMKYGARSAPANFLVYFFRGRVHWSQCIP